ncbi:hypothetical protein HK101_001349 [Irineochytrium annulatum]|nr:hypothetical protein HK101_001349 [Irineochytrium annulatum]
MHDHHHHSHHAKGAHHLTPPHSPEDHVSTVSHAVLYHDTPAEVAHDASLEPNERKARVAVRHAIRNCAALDRYHVRRVIGFGSNGVVLAARHHHQDVAVKIIYKSSSASSTSTSVAATSAPASTLPNEIAILEVIAKEAPHPNVLAYHTHFEDDRHFYLVTELHGATTPPSEDDPEPLVFYNPRTRHTTRIAMSTGSSDLWSWSLAMSQRLSHHTVPFSLPHIAYQLTPPPIATARRIFAQLAAALYHLHSVGVVHGDVKEENVLLDSLDVLNPTPDVRLCDFGHADAPTKNSPDHPPFIRRYGTQEMTPPELLPNLSSQRGASAAHRRSRALPSPSSPVLVDPFPADVFALGMLLFSLLHGPGCLPLAVQETVKGGMKLQVDAWGGYPLGPMRADLDRDGEQLVRWMTMVDPSRRATMGDVIAHPWVRDALVL